MKTLTQGGGYLIIDHSNSPGLTPADVAHIPGAVAVGAGQVYESDTYVCSHCTRQILLHAPAERMHERGLCPKCFAFICNQCNAIRLKTGECVPMAKRIDQAHAIAAKFAGQRDHPDANPDIVLTDVV